KGGKGGGAEAPVDEQPPAETSISERSELESGMLLLQAMRRNAAAARSNVAAAPVHDG
ncbi:unnamed protein product, partial [Polarella glacialis]